MLDPFKKTFTQFINDRVVCFFIIIFYIFCSAYSLSLSPFFLCALRYNVDPCRCLFVWVYVCTQWLRKNNTGRNVLRDIRIHCHPLIRFICSGAPQNRRTPVTRKTTFIRVIITAAAAGLPNRSFVSFKSRHRPNLIYADNCQKHRRK